MIFFQGSTVFRAGCPRQDVSLDTVKSEKYLLIDSLDRKIGLFPPLPLPPHTFILQWGTRFDYRIQFSFYYYTAETIQTAYLLSHGGLLRPKLTRHYRLHFYDRFLEYHGHLLNIIPIPGLSFTTFKEMLQF